MEVDSCSIRLRQTHGQHESKKKKEVGEGQQPLLRKTLICDWYFVQDFGDYCASFKGFVYKQVHLDSGGIKQLKNLFSNIASQAVVFKKTYPFPLCPKHNLTMPDTLKINKKTTAFYKVKLCFKKLFKMCF